jgi:sensor histidine kinase YesM
MKPSVRDIAMVVLITGPLGVLLYGYIFFSNTSKFIGLASDTTGIVWSASVGIVAGFIVYYCNVVLNRWLSWNFHYAARFAAGILAHLVATFLLFLGMASITENAGYTTSIWGPGNINYVDMRLKAAILLMTTILIYNVLYALLYSYQQYAFAQIDKIRRDRKQLELQFEVLKSQLSPHYLFNSLNTISSLIYKDTPSAEQFVRRLAQTYQYILSSQEKRYVQLDEEVDFVQSYYYLLRIRFQQQLQVEINLPSNIMRSKIPPLTLQILVENAVKHNTISNENRLFIYISAQDNTYLRVMNTKTGNAQNIQSFRVGLDNIRKRYAFFTDKRIEITDDEKFIVALPVIEAKDVDQDRQHTA